MINERRSESSRIARLSVGAEWLVQVGIDPTGGA